MDATQLLSVILLPIARMLLRSGFGAGELIRAAKQGLTRKEISSLLGRSLKTKSLPQKSTLEQRAWRVLRGWHTDPKYRERSGRLAALPFAGKQRTFSSLVRRYGGDVTPRSVLRELERIKVVSKTRSGALRLHSGALHSRGLLIQQLSDVALVFRDFAATVAGPDREGNAGYFGFKDAVVPSVDQAALFQHTFAERGAILLESFEQWLKGQTRVTGKPPRSSNGSVRVGVGVYLVQDDSKLDASGRPIDREPMHS